MKVKIILKPAPPFIIQEDRHCRACDRLTDYVMDAEGKFHMYPCCTTDSCQKIVCNQIEEALNPVKM